jgi:hypothetical protein
VQVLCFVVVLGVLILLSYIASSRSRQQKPRHTTVIAILLAGLIGVSAPHSARAEFKIRYPNIDYREVEVEHNYSATFDRRKGRNNDVSSPVEIGAGVLPFWFVEIEGEIEKHPGEHARWEATTFENYFMLTEPGKYWLDFAIFAEYARQTDRNEADTIELGLLFQKQHLQTLHTLNLYWEKPVGALAEPIDTFKYAWQSRYLLNRYFQPGIEIYGEIENLNKPGNFNQQQFRLGPMLAGSYGLGELFGVGKIKYEVGYLFGVTSATEHGTLRTRLEIEFPF